MAVTGTHTAYASTCGSCRWCRPGHCGSCRPPWPLSAPMAHLPFPWRSLGPLLPASSVVGILHVASGSLLGLCRSPCAYWVPCISESLQRSPSLAEVVVASGSCLPPLGICYPHDSCRLSGCSLVIVVVMDSCIFHRHLWFLPVSRVCGPFRWSPYSRGFCWLSGIYWPIWQSL